MLNKINHQRHPGPYTGVPAGKIMKNLLITIFIFSLGCVEHVGESEYSTMQNGEMTIVIDPSVDEIGPDALGIIEDSFESWLDVIDAEISFDFVYGKCTLETPNCVRMMDYSASEVGHAHTVQANGEISRCTIKISRGYEYKTEESETGIDLYHVMLHEAGHCFGMQHSDDTESVMTENFNWDEPGEMKQLSVSDVEMITSRY